MISSSYSCSLCTIENDVCPNPIRPESLNEVILFVQPKFILGSTFRMPGMRQHPSTESATWLRWQWRVVHCVLRFQCSHTAVWGACVLQVRVGTAAPHSLTPEWPVLNFTRHHCEPPSRCCSVPPWGILRLSPSKRLKSVRKGLYYFQRAWFSGVREDFIVRKWQ